MKVEVDTCQFCGSWQVAGWYENGKPVCEECGDPGGQYEAEGWPLDWSDLDDEESDHDD